MSLDARSSRKIRRQSPSARYSILGSGEVTMVSGFCAFLILFSFVGVCVVVVLFMWIGSIESQVQELKRKVNRRPGPNPTISTCSCRDD